MEMSYSSKNDWQVVGVDLDITRGTPTMGLSMGLPWEWIFVPREWVRRD
jgi:hypothetical protein